MKHLVVALCCCLAAVRAEHFQDDELVTKVLRNETFEDPTYADLAVKIDFSSLEGPGQELLGGIYMGNTIALETFSTQFVLDVERAVNVASDRIYVLNVTDGDVHFSWRWTTTIVRFRVLDANATSSLLPQPSVEEAVRDLTDQAQTPSSVLFQGNVTKALDAHWGVVSLDWDMSLRLMFSIDVVGHDLIQEKEHGQTLDWGADRYCEEEPVESAYCEWERHLEEDVARAVAVSRSRIEVLFVRPSAPGSVLCHLRIFPSDDGPSASVATGDLVNQVSDPHSALYDGNVTVRVDPVWGVSGVGGHARPRASPHLSYAPRANSSLPYHGYGAHSRWADYERCKATQRCARGYTHYNGSTAEVNYTTQVFAGGKHEHALFFANFENWRMGSYGWSRRGLWAHEHRISPFSRESTGPRVRTIDAFQWCHERQPCSPQWNDGLVLNEQELSRDVALQSALVENIISDRDWIVANAETAVMDADGARTRRDVAELMKQRQIDVENKLTAETAVLKALNVSQCRQYNCSLLVNTSSAQITGVIEVEGVVLTVEGVETAVFAFESISLDSNVEVTIVGQRALVLTSRTSVYINTTLDVNPGTLGGFPGGFSVARFPEDMLSDTPRDVPLDLAQQHGLLSNNVNGPGSPNTRVHLRTVSTLAADVKEQQRLEITVDDGETLAGTFRLMGYGYTTRRIQHDVSADDLAIIIFEDLNRQNSLADPHGVGRVGVASATPYKVQGARAWAITFTSHIGTAPVLTVEYVGDTKAGTVTRLVEGNTISGSFRLEFNGQMTRELSAYTTAPDMALALVEDMWPYVQSAGVSQSNADRGIECDDGLCANGPTPGGGLTWTLTLTTLSDNVTPLAPTDPLALEAAETPSLNASFALLLRGTNATVKIERGHVLSNLLQLNRLNSTASSFSLAFGGAGAGYGGAGGRGLGGRDGAGAVARAITEKHNNTLLESVEVNSLGGSTGGVGLPYDGLLLGGSGGGMGYSHPFVVANFGGSSLPARGGAGGGAVEIVAANDIEIGPGGFISVDGGPGLPGQLRGGGGGSGGLIALKAGGVLRVNGQLSVQGGDGGAGEAGEEAAQEGDWDQQLVVTSGGGGGGGGGGRVVLHGRSVTAGTVHLDGGVCQELHSGVLEGCFDVERDGAIGSLENGAEFEEVEYDISDGGAFGTLGAMRLRGRGSSPFNGPEYQLAEEAARPARLSFFVRLDPAASRRADRLNGAWGGMLALVEVEEHDTTEDPWMTGFAGSRGNVQSANVSVVFGLRLNNLMSHGSGFRVGPEEANLTLGKAEQKRWYKIDVSFDWSKMVYDVFVDDVIRADDAPLHAKKGIHRIGLYAIADGGDVSFDEVYLGPDHTMGFKCPRTTREGLDFEIERPEIKGWTPDDLGPRTRRATMSRRNTHVSRREVYQHADGGLVPFDGDGAVEFRSDVHDLKKVNSDVNAGSLLTVEGKRYWYGEHDAEQGPLNDGDAKPPWLLGGLGGCSTDDLVTWRREGVMLHYANLTDMVNPDREWQMGCGGYSTTFGTQDGYGCQGSLGLHARRPRVLKAQSSTHDFVMWMRLDNANESLSMAGVSSAAHPGGPFSFRRSLYPDGNQTRDMSVWDDQSSMALLGRSYYTTVEYVLPSAQMMPIWEMVRGGSGERDFALSYHRATYLYDYDDYHDIYLQRWRLEDKPWEVVCVNRTDPTRYYNVARGESTGENGAVCPDPDFYKIVIGQGTDSGIKSRFKDKRDANNSFWRPDSVPSVKAQPWANNYIDGSCGSTGVVDEDYDKNDADIPDRERRNRQNCSNVADNPVHGTSSDELVGQSIIRESRRTKFLAVSSLTPDLMDTTGVLETFEGELEEGMDLDTLLQSYGQFDWSIRASKASQKFSTAEPPLESRHFHSQKEDMSRFSQYAKTYNDRAFYSLACVIDGTCPVNFINHKDSSGSSSH